MHASALLSNIRIFVRKGVALMAYIPLREVVTLPPKLNYLIMKYFFKPK